MKAFSVGLLALVHAAGCAPAREATHSPPAPDGEAPAAVDGEVMWTPYDLAARCGPPPGEPDLLSPKHPLVVLTSEAEYVRHTCVKSDIDWSRFRLVVHTARETRERLLLDGVTRDGPDLVVSLRYSGVCEPYSFAYIVAHVAVLLPVGEERVRTVLLQGPGSCER